ncbi:chromate transporter [Pragia fontium]|uniref:chromate transporter n=1 Tax=Pragia fontium TaxID=82985 RepID=UPI00064AA0BA|nr:chromate transporter [Pragia fontium]AKJ40729.1 hypothetical protein QQ39_00465 [Pragia fontium]
MTNSPINDSRPWSVFLIFLRLGLTSFGGPIAHLGYFHAEFVIRRRWLSERSYVDLVAFCQFLPGPASSQVGIALGLSRAGYCGALPFWERLRCNLGIQAALAGINAAVVGLLMAALYYPVWTSAIFQPQDFGLALVALVALMFWKLPPWLVVISSGVVGWLLSFAL